MLIGLATSTSPRVFFSPVECRGGGLEDAERKWRPDVVETRLTDGSERTEWPSGQVFAQRDTVNGM